MPAPVPDSRAACQALDDADPLAPLRDGFTLPDGVIYLDGNSLGALPSGTAAYVERVVRQEWGRDLVRAWNTAGWIGAPHRVGDKIARLIGAAAGEVVVADSTSVNLYKVLHAALALAGAAPSGSGADPETGAPPGIRRRLLVDATAFPTDRYIADSVAAVLGRAVEPVDPLRVTDALDADVAVVLMNHVDYRTGRLHDLAAVTASVHAAGALAVWDLAHSAGALPVDLHAADADLAVGCGYKYLNGGPGAPAYLWVHPRHQAAASQPLAGWMGHAAPFAMDDAYRPADGITRFLCGTPPILSLAALECGVDSVLAAEPLGGLDAIRASSLAQTALFRRLVADRCPTLTCITPEPDGERGSQIAFTHPDGAYAIVRALIEHGVIGDFRAPDVLRFAVTPLYTRFTDVWDAVDVLAGVLASGEWRDPRHAVRAAVT